MTEFTPKHSHDLPCPQRSHIPMRKERFITWVCHFLWGLYALSALINSSRTLSSKDPTMCLCLGTRPWHHWRFAVTQGRTRSIFLYYLSTNPDFKPLRKADTQKERGNYVNNWDLPLEYRNLFNWILRSIFYGVKYICLSLKCISSMRSFVLI